MFKRGTYTLAIVLVTFVAVPCCFGQDSVADNFRARCATCHGDDGLGNTSVGKALGVKSFRTPDVLKLSNLALTSVIKDGKEKMPAFKEQLTDGQIRDLLQYIHKLQKK